VIQEAGSWAPCTQVFRPEAGARPGRCTRAETPRTHLHNTGGCADGPGPHYRTFSGTCGRRGRRSDSSIGINGLTRAHIAGSRVSYDHVRRFIPRLNFDLLSCILVSRRRQSFPLPCVLWTAPELRSAFHCSRVTVICLPGSGCSTPFPSRCSAAIATAPNSRLTLALLSGPCCGCWRRRCWHRPRRRFLC